MCVLNKGNRNTKSLAYLSLVCPILEYGSACWEPYIEGHINALDRVQKKAAQFSNHTKGSDWETLAQHRTIARLCALFKAYSGNRLGKFYTTGCECLTTSAGLIMFRKLGKEPERRYREVFLCK
jgi:hypothetical protein